MDNNINIETWDQLKSLGTEQIVEYMNHRLSKGNTIEDIMGKLGVARGTGSRYLRNRGYRYDGSKFAPHQEESQQTTKPKKVSAKPANPKPDTTLQAYADVHNTLKQLDTTDYIRTSISMAKETHKKLDDFLKDKPLLKKQDFITHALELAIDKYSK